MKIRIRKREGFWKTYFAYGIKTEDDYYEVFMDKYETFEEALAVALFVVGVDRSV